ncbi:MAG: 8-oxo-dGTP pyrophosphatase MutT (NUDIX family) [Halioglobus sp.]|jgi:8-oxo-dGTP pyrophosphatase MutT (NUDIX family)
MGVWAPHATVAVVVEQDGQYLIVEERDKGSGEMVFNQPAGHLEKGESLLGAALRETLEETGWQVELTGVLSVALYESPANGKTYYRTTFVGLALQKLENAVIDPDIHAVHWLDYEALKGISARMRSPLVLASIERHRRGIHYPLDLIDNP